MSLMSRSSGVNENATEAPAWPAIVPVGRQPDLPAYPVDTLPEPLRRWATEVARSLSCPVDLPAILALGAASACVAARYAVRAKADWVEPLNLYLLLGLSSGESKSAAFGPALRPLRAWEREQHKAGLELFEESKSKRRELERRLKQAEKEAAQGGHQEERERAARELARHRVIEPQRLVTEDATPEALGVLMSRQHGRMALFSDEAAPLEVLAGRYSEGRAVVELFNKAYSGTPYICDRVLRETLRVESPTLTTVLTVQPSCVEALADTPDFEGKGTLGRFLFSLPRSFVGRRVFDVAPVFEGVQDSYAAALRGLLALPADLDDEGDSFKPRLVSLSQAARDEVTAFRTRLEPRLGERDGDLAHMASWGNKAHGQVVRVAGVLHLMDTAAQGVDPRGVAVPVETVRRALRVVEGYFLPHAMAAWGLMSTSPRHRRLRLLARWIENLPEGQRESVTQREAHRRLDDRQGIDADEVRSLLGELVERGYLMAGPRMDGSRGRPHGAALLVNPALYAKAERVPGMEG